ncbi:polysaccharide export outer membrane protein [Sphingomonas sp. OV641]|uniref:polysaccharide biosynthesis/export family protein n=1 Tax=Sphingomonas sp. OV641 TaxID=1881068 RepID=UPI0008AD0C14|nr:polysaccharide biosynthesis/export family protein [Sphingomonas sp. OV641]SEI82927.1 polysaccharide export outer membrane protein [Sphingomonas sp. OV641]
MRMLAASLALSLPVIFSACSNGVSHLSTIDAPAQNSYRLGPGDELRLAVFGFDQMANVYTVADNGDISLPLLGAIKADQRTPAELESAISSQLLSRELATKPSVSVQIVKYRPIYILGEVQKPGQYPYVPGMTVTTAVAIAGGYTFRASTKMAAVTRSGTDVERRADAVTKIMPGDTIRVPEAWF